jgi:hypothetical protein
MLGVDRRLGVLGPRPAGASFAPSTFSGTGFATFGTLPRLLPNPSSPSFIFS